MGDRSWLLGVGRSAPRIVLFVALAHTLATPAAAQRLILEEPKPAAGVFATVGIGVIDVEEGTGLGVPFGLAAISPRHRVMARVTLVDIGLLQGKVTDFRYRRYYDAQFGQEVCYDTTTGRLAPFSRCAGDTDILRSFGGELSFLPVETLYVGNKPGSLHAGIGLRATDPRTLYGTIGMFFPAHTGRAAGVHLAMGRDYIFLGFAWGIDVRRAGGLF